MAATFKLTDEVRDVLNRSVIEGMTLKLPEQLDRALYLSVNKVIDGAGGRWNRRLGVHVFANDPRGILGLAVATGKGVNVQQTLQAFYTPQAVVHRMIELAEIRPGMTVLEPSAGRGALAAAARYAGAHVTCYEIDASVITELRERGFTVRQIDFLKVPWTAAALFDRALMNPPFTKGQAVAHVAHAFKFLKPGGILVGIVPDNFWTKATKATRPILDELAAAVGPEVGRNECLPTGTFRESGTDVATRIIVLRRAL
jgi:protein-L-isoaspartate O-methyltransferase